MSERRRLVRRTPPGAVTMTETFGSDGIGDVLTEVFVDHLARNTPDLGRGPGYYGVRLEKVSPDGSELDLIVTFQAENRYCCSQPGCHFGFGDAATWSELREVMDARGLQSSPLPRVNILRIVVEEGASFDPGGLRSPPLRCRGYVHEYGPLPPVVESGEE